MLRILSRWFPPPQIFVSYAREDDVLTQGLCRVLIASGFVIYRDVDKNLPGENFVTRIRDELQRCDGVLAVLSHASAGSEWCRTELLLSEGMRKRFAPVRVEPDPERPVVLPSSLAAIFERLEQIILRTPADVATAAEKVVGMFAALRRARRIRIIRRLMIFAIAAAAVTLLISYGRVQINVWTELRARTATIREIEGASRILSGDRIQGLAARWQNDRTFTSSLLMIANDVERPAMQRLNAHLMATALLVKRGKDDGLYLKDLDWHDSGMTGGALTNVAFVSGSAQTIEFKNVAFGGAQWAREFFLSAVTFAGCRFQAGGFDGTNAAGVKFHNCWLRGTHLDVRNFGDVEFASVVVESRSTIIVSGEVCMLDNCDIENNVSLPTSASNAHDFSGPENEMRFKGVVFDSCHFRGLIRPEWFSDCTLKNCVFPIVTKQAAMERQQNRLINCAWNDESPEN